MSGDQGNNIKQKTPRIWHPQHEKVLKSWGESASCYRYLHYKSYQMYKLMNMRFTLPVIIISTVTGTANFAQQTFPNSWQLYVPSVIGALNLLAAIMTTVQQFLKVSELMESHRVSSINYGKLARHIRLEVTLPVSDRTYHGHGFIDVCSVEYDRLLQQCPPIPGVILNIFDVDFPEKKSTEKFVKFTRPELLCIKEINPYEGVFETVIEKFKNSFGSKKDQPKINDVKDALRKELEDLRIQTLVSSPRQVIIEINEQEVEGIPSHPADPSALN